MKHLSLCTGIGGLDLAAEWAGFETAAQCEIDEYASRILAKNFRGVPNLHDIRTVTNERLAELGIDRREITVISAGFPCQPYSLAGKGRGDRDERDLWGEVARVVGELRPKWFVGENTPGLFARSNQRYFRRVLDDLAALGYSVGWGIWGACDVGAPHKRDRVFIMAHADGIGRDVFRTENRELSAALGKSETKTSLRAGGLCRNPRGGQTFRETFCTPMALDGERTRLPNSALARHWIKKGGGTNLAEQIAHQEVFPTPTVQDSKNIGFNGSHQFNLHKYVAIFPTPTVSGNYNRKGSSKKAGNGLATVVSCGNGGKLNPTWVEWLMGFPLGWTDCDASGTQ